MKDKVNIGITFFWGETYKDIWSNGAGQNMYFLKELLKQIPWINEVYFVYWNNDKKELSKNLEIDSMDVELYDYKDVLEKTDILIEGTLTLEEVYEKAFHAHGAKIISFRMGDDMIWDMTKFIHNMQGGRAFNNSRYDAVWLIPQIAKTNRSYLQIMKRVKVDVVPHLWSPFFLNQYVDKENIQNTYKYQPSHSGDKRISIFESNIEVLKTCYIPILIAEEAYHRAPKKISHVYVCNTYDRRELPVFHDFIGWTKLVKDNILTVEGRFKMPSFFNEYTDIIISHQWELGLNYAYYEALYADYPLIHNSEFLREANVGYFYPEFDALKGADVLLEAISYHDNLLPLYKERTKKFLETLSPYNEYNIKYYESLLKQVLSESK